MIITNLRAVIEAHRGVSPPYLRNLLKEELQNYVLEFVYNSPQYQQLIFTGGTCLRKIYNLPRLSEDLDFDYDQAFDLNQFALDITRFFEQHLQYAELQTKLTGSQQTLFLKFPLMQALGLGQASEVLFIRCDFAAVAVEARAWRPTEVVTLTSPTASLFLRCYTLPALFAHKIQAFLSREYFQGREQTVPVEGRDVYDLVWFIEQSKRENLQPHWVWLQKSLGLSPVAIAEACVAKVETIEEKSVLNDLQPFLASPSVAQHLARTFPQIITAGIKRLADTVQ